MPRKRKQTVKVNNVASLEGMMQETYNDACVQINDAQKAITELTNKVDKESTDNDDLTKIFKSKADLLKVKENGIKFKLELAKLQNDTLKYNGAPTAAVISSGDITTSGSKPSLDDFAAVRKMIENKNNEEG
jgi:hypothetical protein